MNERDHAALVDEPAIGQTLLESMGFDCLNPRGGGDSCRWPHGYVDVGRQSCNAVDDGCLGAEQIPGGANGRECAREIGEEISDG